MYVKCFSIETLYSPPYPIDIAPAVGGIARSTQVTLQPVPVLPDQRVDPINASYNPSSLPGDLDHLNMCILLDDGRAYE